MSAAALQQTRRSTTSLPAISGLQSSLGTLLLLLLQLLVIFLTGYAQRRAILISLSGQPKVCN
jgi:hypothetical protein